MRSALIVLLATAGLVACDNTVITPADTQPAHVEVQGVAETTAVPDRFILRLVFTELGNDVAAMKSSLDAKVAETLAAARALGVEDKQLRANAMTVQPEWEWQPERRLIGQRVSRDVQIRVDGFDTYTSLLERLAALKPDELRQEGAEVRDLTALENQVLEQAVINARARAQLLAQAAGRELGEALVIIEQGTQLPGPVPLRAMAMEATADKAAYSTGETTVRSQVLVRFRLQ